MPSPEFIPGELTDAIIEFVTDRKTLLACALVCRNWLPASRHRLFEEIDITCMQYDLFVARVLQSEAMRPWLSSVRHFALRDLASESVVEENGLRRSQYLLHDIIGRFPNLTELELMDADWIQRPPHPSVHHILRPPVALPSLRRLVLYNHLFPSFSSLRRLLASLSHLEDLVMEQVLWPPAVHDLSSVRAATSPALVTLYIRTDTPRPESSLANLLTWLAHTPSRRSIREIRFDPEWTDSHVAFLRVVAPHLTRLRLYSLDVDSYLITELVNLCSLELTYMWTWREITSLLQILPARLHYLKIPINPRNEGDILVGIGDHELELLEPILEKAQFAGLTSLEFQVVIYGQYLDGSEVSFAPPEIKIAEIVRQKLPKLHARGVISICVDDLRLYVPPEPTVDSIDSGISNEGGPALG